MPPLTRQDANCGVLGNGQCPLLSISAHPTHRVDIHSCFCILDTLQNRLSGQSKGDDHCPCLSKHHGRHLRLPSNRCQRGLPVITIASGAIDYIGLAHSRTKGEALWAIARLWRFLYICRAIAIVAATEWPLPGLSEHIWC